MKNVTRTICLTLALFLGSVGTGCGPDFNKGVAAYESGDFATALGEFRPLAEQGDARAQFNLGVMYEKGRGVPQDDKIALKWFTLAAEQGYARAQHNLGLMYDKGEGVPQDYKTAVKWYELATEQGKSSAQNNLKKMKSRLVSKGIDGCLFDEIEKLTGPETKKIVETHCRSTMEKKSLDWLLRYAD